MGGSGRAAAPTDGSSFSVLVLDQGDSTRPAYQAFMRSFQETLSEAGNLHLRVHEENLRLADFDSPSYRDSLADWLRRKYSNESIHCLVAGGAKAVDVALELRRELWPSASLVYAGVSARLASRLETAGRTTGLWIDLDPGATLEAALRMFPGARHVAWISNDTFYPDVESESRDSFQRTAERFGVKVWPINSTNLRETRANLARLPDQAIAILSIGAYQKEDQRWVSLQEAMEELRREERVPIFVQSETLIGQGAVGGVCYMPGKMGVEVADLVTQVLRSTPADLPPPRASRATSMIFDWQQLQRWGVDLHSVPSGSDLRHRPTSVWREYRGRLVAGGVTLVVQTSLLGWLLWERRSRRRSEATALRLGRQLLAAHEAERRRVGRELHDDVSQRIARLAIDTHRLEYAHKWLVPELASLRSKISTLGRDVHSLAYRLHPAALMDLGLEEAMREECGEFARRHGGRVDFEGREVPGNLPDEVSLGLFRVAQESLQNVMRHAEATRVTVELAMAGDILSLKVEDNGIGFRVKDHEDKGSLGLISMRERLADLGGGFQVNSRVGLGTCVSAWVRMSKVRQKAAPAETPERRREDRDPAVSGAAPPAGREGGPEGMPA